MSDISVKNEPISNDSWFAYLSELPPIIPKMLASLYIAMRRSKANYFEALQDFVLEHDAEPNLWRLPDDMVSLLAGTQPNSEKTILTRWKEIDFEIRVND